MQNSLTMLSWHPVSTGSQLLLLKTQFIVYLWSPNVDDYDAEYDDNDKRQFVYTVFNKYCSLWKDKRIVLTARKQNKYLETHQCVRSTVKSWITTYFKI